MCYLNYRPYDSEGPDSPPPRSSPKLGWAVPVDIVQLGSSLEAHSNTMKQTTALRLIHRFRNGALSKLPQEILEQIIDDVRTEQQTICERAWKSAYSCFEQTCRPEDHYLTYGPEVAEMWNIINEEMSHDGRDDTDDPSEQEMVDIVVQEVIDCPDLHYELDGYNLCEKNRDTWIDRVCCCSRTVNGKETNKGFLELQKILLKHFGLEALVQHEIFHHPLSDFLPHDDRYGYGSYHTVAYLCLAEQVERSYITGGRNAPSPGGKSVEGSSHMVFRQNIDPSLLNLTDDRRRRFASAMRALHIRPRFHLAELEPLVRRPIQNKELLEIDASSIQTCPGHRATSFAQRNEKLEEYIAKKDQELAKQAWPQLLLLAGTDTTSPSWSHSITSSN